MSIAVATYSVRLELDMLPPSVNHLYKSTGGGRRALTDEALTFRGLVAVTLHGQPKPPEGAELVLSVWLTYGNKRRQDADNRLKALSDALALALGYDDRRVMEWHVYAESGSAAGVAALLEARL